MANFDDNAPLYPDVEVPVFPVASQPIEEVYNEIRKNSDHVANSHILESGQGSDHDEKMDSVEDDSKSSELPEVQAQNDESSEEEEHK